MYSLCFAVLLLAKKNQYEMQATGQGAGCLVAAIRILLYVFGFFGLIFPVLWFIFPSLLMRTFHPPKPDVDVSSQRREFTRAIRWITGIHIGLSVIILVLLIAAGAL